MNESTQQDENTHAAWPGGIAAITVFVGDLAAAKRFYSDVFQLPLTSKTTTRPSSSSVTRSSTC